MITIIRYNNRKLYNTITHKYISLKDINIFVNGKIPFKVLEYKSLKDITVLTSMKALVQSLS